MDKIHGLTDKLQSLGGHIGGHDSSSDAKGKSGETLTVMNPFELIVALHLIWCLYFFIVALYKIDFKLFLC